MKFSRLDLRSLALFRICLGLMVLIDLGLRSRNFTDHYTEHGIAPVSLLANDIGGAYPGWSIFVVFAQDWWPALLLLLAGVFSIMLLVGYRSRFSSIATWLLMISLYARCPYVCYGADRVMAMMLFWGMWLPLGHRWGVDAGRKRTVEAEVYSGATVAFTLQVALIYWMSALAKSDPAWRGNFTAVEWSLRLDSYSTAFGQFLLGFPELLRWATKATLWLEELGPLLLFTPLWRTASRILAIALFIFFHLGLLATTLHLGIFPFVCAVAWLPFLPSAFWDVWSKRRDASHFEALQAPALQSAFCILLTAYLALWNIRSISRSRDSWYFPKAWSDAGRIFGLQQRWGLYAPRPRSSDGWLVASALLEDGRSVDLLNHGDPVSFDRPVKLWHRFENSRQRGYLQTLYYKPRPLLLQHFVGHLTTKWTENGGASVESLTLYMMLEDHRNPTARPARIQIWPSVKEDGGSLLPIANPGPLSIGN